MRPRLQRLSIAIARGVAEVFGLETRSWRGWLRYVAWAAVTTLLFVATGGAVLSPLRAFAEELFGLDKAIRMAALIAIPAKDLVPITLVEIDDATAKQWAMTDATPRRELTRVLQVASAAGAAAIVVDIDLADAAADKPEAQQREREFRQFLEAYRAASPIILVRRVIVESDGSIRESENRLVRALSTAANPRVSWAHALYVTDEDGTVRRWQETVQSCVDGGGSELLPAVPIAVLAQARWPTAAFGRPSYAPRQGTGCMPDLTRPSHVVVFGGRLTGTAAHGAGTSVMRVAAWQLTDTRVQREDTTLFGGRVAIIGGTHEHANDIWRTPIGMMPGVELIANTIRFGSTQLQADARPPRRGWIGSTTVGILGLFAAYLAAVFFLRGSLAAATAVGLSGAVIYVSLAFTGFYSILDVVESSVLLFAQFSILNGVFEIVAELRQGWVKALLASRFSDDRADPRQPQAREAQHETATR